MKTTFPVHWIGLFRSLTIFMSVAIAIPIGLLMLIRFAQGGFDFAKTFEHMSFLAFIGLLFVGIPCFSGLFAFLMAQYFRLAKITIEEEQITGRNFWGLKNRFPLSDIKSLESFSSNGINAIVVCSHYHGKIYISEYTERLDELLQIIEPYLPEEQNV